MSQPHSAPERGGFAAVEGRALAGRGRVTSPRVCHLKHDLAPILSRSEAAAALGIAESTLRRWETERRIPFSRLSQKVSVYLLDDPQEMGGRAEAPVCRITQKVTVYSLAELERHDAAPEEARAARRKKSAKDSSEKGPA